VRWGARLRTFLGHDTSLSRGRALFVAAPASRTATPAPAASSGSALAVTFDPNRTVFTFPLVS
jgi:hypothetical protein